jgi:imidazolonepropionase-like amidohydrolase
VCPGLHYLRQVVEGNAESYGFTPEKIGAALYPEELEAALDGYRKLHGNGVRIVAGGDFGHQWTRHGTYAAELASYVELIGLSPLEALLTATANAGPIVGERLGRIQEGYLADLVVVDGDPTTDIRVLLDADRIGPVVKAGRPVALPAWDGVTAWTRSRA